ncbi:MAG: TonB-dependent receptor, partial [Phycisphaerae bacterium]|nr:TonB-dependent receptor [Phycisphaerae bacterium]
RSKALYTSTTQDFFDMDIEELMNIQVTTAGRKAQSLNMAASNITIITEKDIKDSGAQTLADVLERLPGVYVATTGSGLKTIYIRGIGERYNDKTVLLVDGYPMRDIYYYSYSPDETIPLGNIKRIEVIRGPGSSLYGTCAYAGIIDIITKDAEDLKGTEIMSGIGSRSSQQHQILTGKKWERGEITFLARYFDVDQGTIDRDEGGTVSGKSRTARNAAFHMKAKYEDFEFQTGYYRVTTPDPMSSTDNRYKTVTEDMFFRGGYKREFSDRLNMQAKMYANLQWVEEDKLTYDAGVLDEKKHTSRQSDLVGIDIQFLYKLSERNDLVFGMNYERENLEHHWSYKSKASTGWVQGAKTGTSRYSEDFPMPIRNHSISFYAEDEFKLIPDVLHFTAGARLDRYTQTGSNLSLRFAMVWKARKDTVIKLLYGEAFRSPSYREMYKRDDPYVETPEKIRTTELLISHNLNRNHNLEISLFKSELKDYIKTLQSGGYENLNHRSSKGVEVGLKGKFHNANLSYFANCTMLQTKDVDLGGIGGVPENMFNAGLTYEGIKHIAISPHIQHIGKRNRPDDYQHTDEMDDVANRRDNLGSYTLCNITIRTTDLPFELSFSVRNVFDKKYYSTSEKGQYDTQGEGRMFWLTLGYTFK